MITKEDLKFILNFFKNQFDELKGAFSQKITIDLGQASKDLSIAASEITKLAQSVSDKDTKESEADNAIIRSEDYLILIAESLKKSQQSLEKISKSESKMDVPKEFITAISSLTTAIETIKKTESKELDMSIFKNIVSTLDKISIILKSPKNERLETIMMQVLARLNAIKFDFPKTLKLDEMQLRQLSTRGGSTSVSLSGGPSTNGVVYDGRKVVAVTNTPVKLAPVNTLCEELFITALSTNTDVIVIGGPSVVYTEATRTGRSMNPGDSIVIKIHDVGKVYVNGTANDGVAYTYTA